MYNELGLYSYSTPAVFGRPAADRVLETAEDYTTASCQLDRSNITAVQLHLATVGPISKRFVFDTISVPELSFVQPATLSEMGGQSLLIEGQFAPDDIDLTKSFFCFFSHSPTLNGPVYETSAYFQNHTHVVCAAPPGPSQRVRLSTEAGDVSNSVYVYVAATFTPVPMSSLKLSYVPNPILNYTFPVLGHTGGNENVAVIGMNFISEEIYRLQVGTKNVPCLYRSNTMLTCVTPLGEEFRDSNQERACHTPHATNQTLYQAKNQTFCSTPFAKERIGNAAPLGLSFNGGVSYWTAPQTLNYFDRTIQTDELTTITIGIPDIGETFVALPGIGFRGPNVANLNNNSAAINDRIVCDFGVRRVYPTFINGSYTICPTRYATNTVISSISCRVGGQKPDGAQNYGSHPIPVFYGPIFSVDDVRSCDSALQQSPSSILNLMVYCTSTSTCCLLMHHEMN